MNRVRVCVSLGSAALFLVLAGCVQEVAREETISPTVSLATPLPASTFTLVPSPTATPASSLTATSARTPTITSTRSPTTAPTLTPTLSPTATPAPTVHQAPRLVLEVRAPADGGTVRGDAVVVHGVTTPGASVNIEDVVASVGADGRFQAELTLSPEVNVIRVVATDSEGNRESRVLSVTSLALPPQPFLLLVTEPEDQSIVLEGSIRLSGRTGPEAVTSINGVSVSVDELGFFSTTLTLDPGPNIIDVVATNNDGQVLSTVTAVIFRP